MPVQRSPGHKSQPQGVVDVHSDHGIVDEPTQETGQPSNFS